MATKCSTSPEYKSTYYTIRNKLVKDIAKALELPVESICRFLHTSKVTVDYDFMLQLQPLSKLHKIDMHELFTKLEENSRIGLENLTINNNNENIESIEQIPASQFMKSLKLVASSAIIYLNIPIIMPYVLNQIQTQGKNYGQRPERKDVVCVEFSSPNIAKQFHPGHLRTTLIGNFISLLYKKFGYKVIDINYLGDYGKQFGLIIEGIKRFPDEKRLAEEPTKYAYEVYVKISRLAEKDDTVDGAAKENFKKLEKGDEETVRIWRRLREESIKEFQQQYKTLNVNFDIFSGESYFGKEVKSPMLTKDADGSNFFDLGDLGKVVVQRSNGTTLYSARDIHSATQRFSIPNVSKLIWVVASQQDKYFKQIFKILQMMDHKTECLHISYGMVKDMSTRKGTVIFLNDVIKEAKEKMYNVMKKDDAKFKLVKDPENTALELALSAILVQDFSARRIKDYKFDIDKFTSIEGDTGPSLQYTYCRLESIKNKNIELLEKHGQLVFDAGCDEPDNAQVIKDVNISGEKFINSPAKKEKKPKIPIEKVDFSILIDEDISRLVSLLLKLDYVLEDSMNTHEPCKIITYCFSLSNVINRLFASCKVFGQAEETSIARIYVFESARYALGVLMEVIGLRPLQRI